MSGVPGWDARGRAVQRDAHAGERRDLAFSGSGPAGNMEARAGPSARSGQAGSDVAGRYGGKRPLMAERISPGAKRRWPICPRCGGVIPPSRGNAAPSIPSGVGSCSAAMVAPTALGRDADGGRAVENASPTGARCGLARRGGGGRFLGGVGELVQEIQHGLEALRNGLIG